MAVANGTGTHDGLSRATGLCWPGWDGTWRCYGMRRVGSHIGSGWMGGWRAWRLVDVHLVA